MIKPDVTLVEREDGFLYAKEVSTDFDQPRKIISFWPLVHAQYGTVIPTDRKIRYADLRRIFASEELAQKLLGCKLFYERAWGGYKDERGWYYALPKGSQTTAQFVEFETIPEPVQRGRKLPVKWERGEWWKETKQAGKGPK